MREYRKTGPHLIESGADWIRIRGRAGLDVSYQGRQYDVSSEMLFPPMTIALFVSRGDAIPAPDADDIVTFVREGLESVGFTVEVQ